MKTKKGKLRWRHRSKNYTVSAYERGEGQTDHVEIKFKKDYQLFLSLVTLDEHGKPIPVPPPTPPKQIDFKKLFEELEAKRQVTWIPKR
jgi:hypothetical protein